MNTRRFAIMAAAFCGTVVLAGWVVARLPGFATASIENSGAVPIEDRAASLAANAIGGYVGDESAGPSLPRGVGELAWEGASRSQYNAVAR